MTYDLLIRDGRIVDGSGMSAFRGDVGVKNGKIAEIGRLSGPATRTVDAQGAVVAPGFIDNHCHYDAQVTWDPLCSYSCDHGATTVIFRNCSLWRRCARASRNGSPSSCSHVEAIPMDVLRTVAFTWETVPQYIDQLDRNLGVNVGQLIGHTAVRYYVMGDECQKRAARWIPRSRRCRTSFATGCWRARSVFRSRATRDTTIRRVSTSPHCGPRRRRSSRWANVLRELGTGIIQSGGGNGSEMKNSLMSRLSEATGRPVIYNNLNQSMRRPNEWKEQMAHVDATIATGHPRLPHQHAQPHHRFLHDGEHADLPWPANLASNSALYARREDACVQ